MRVATQDYELVFLGLAGNASFGLWGVAADGTLTRLYQPGSQVEGGNQRLGSMGIAQSNLAEVGGDLWFTSLETEYSEAGGNRAQGFDVIVNRLSGDGVLNTEVTRFEMAQATGYQGQSFWQSAIDWQGAYTLPVLDATTNGQLGVVNGDVFSVSQSGEAEQLSDLFRDGGHPDAALAGLGDVLYYIADQQSPLNSSDELWRRNADGTNEVVFNDPAGDVVELESFAGAAWFTVAYLPLSGVGTPGFYRVGDTGTPDAVDLSALGRVTATAPRLKQQDGRLFFYTAQGKLGEVTADGTVTSLVQEGELFGIRDIALFDGDIYVAGSGRGVSRALYRLEEDGTVVEIPGIGGGYTDRAVEVFAATENRLYMLGNDTIDDGFGGTELIGGNLWSMDGDEVLTRLTGEQSANPDIRAAGALFPFEIDAPDGPFGTDGDDVLQGSPTADTIEGGAGDDRLAGFGGDDLLEGQSGHDTLNGGDGNDTLLGGDTPDDLRDVIYAGAGDDSADGGFGNDLIYGGAGNDTIEGGFGVDEIVGQAGDDVLSGGAWSDLIFGGEGSDFINGGFGHDRVNGGADADRFFHLGIFDHGSDWIQDFAHAEGDRLVFGNASATADQFQVNIAETPNAGQAGVAEAFVIYRPTGQILWALVDGAEQESLMIQIGGELGDLLA